MNFFLNLFFFNKLVNCYFVDFLCFIILDSMYIFWLFFWERLVYLCKLFVYLWKLFVINGIENKYELFYVVCLWWKNFGKCWELFWSIFIKFKLFFVGKLVCWSFFLVRLYEEWVICYNCLYILLCMVSYK